MEKIEITIYQDDVYGEVAKATEYTGAKLIDGDATAHDRILATDADLSTLSRFWEESVLACNERLKEMLLSGATRAVTDTDEKARTAYVAELEVSKNFDKELTASVQSTVRNYFVASIVAQWFKFANKAEQEDYYTQAADLMMSAERLLYSRRRPTRPQD